MACNGSEVSSTYAHWAHLCSYCLHVPPRVCCPAVDRLQPQASQRAIEAAGSLAAAGAGDVAAAAEQLHKIFFGRPTISMPALFQAVAAQAAQIRWVQSKGGLGSSYLLAEHTMHLLSVRQHSLWQLLAAAVGCCILQSGAHMLSTHACGRGGRRRSSTGAGEASGGAGVLLHQLLGLCGLLVAAADAAGEMQRALRQSAHNEVSKAQAAGPGWLAGQGPRAAWSELSEVRA